MTLPFPLSLFPSFKVLQHCFLTMHTVPPTWLHYRCGSLFYLPIYWLAGFHFQDLLASLMLWCVPTLPSGHVAWMSLYRLLPSDQPPVTFGFMFGIRALGLPFLKYGVPGAGLCWWCPFVCHGMSFFQQPSTRRLFPQQMKDNHAGRETFHLQDQFHALDFQPGHWQRREILTIEQPFIHLYTS